MSTLTILVVLGLASAVVGAAVSAYVAAAKRRSVAEGVVLGTLLGLFGILVVALLPNGERHPGGRWEEPEIDSEDEAALKYLSGIPPEPPESRGLRSS